MFDADYPAASVERAPSGNPPQTLYTITGLKDDNERIVPVEATNAVGDSHRSRPDCERSPRTRHPPPQRYHSSTNHTPMLEEQLLPVTASPAGESTQAP